MSKYQTVRGKKKVKDKIAEFQRTVIFRVFTTLRDNIDSLAVTLHLVASIIDYKSGCFEHTQHSPVFTKAEFI